MPTKVQELLAKYSRERIKEALEENRASENFAIRDATKTPFVKEQGYVPAKEKEANHTPNVDITENVMGFMPVIGDIMQGGQAALDFANGNYKMAALNAGLLFVPNVIEKPIKYAGKLLRRMPIDGAFSSAAPYVGRNLVRHGVPSDYVSDVLRGESRAMTPSMAVNRIDEFNTVGVVPFKYGDYTFIGDKSLLDDSVIFHGDAGSPVVGDIINGFESVPSEMREGVAERLWDATINGPYKAIGKRVSIDDLSHLPTNDADTYFEAIHHGTIPYERFKGVIAEEPGRHIYPTGLTKNQEEDILNWFNGKGVKVKTFNPVYNPYKGYSGWAESIMDMAQELGDDVLFKDGGKIHIKPSHRGRLTELKERTGKTEAELYSDGNPAHKKMVVFARNARKWHGGGGLLRRFNEGGDSGNGKTRFDLGDWVSRKASDIWYRRHIAPKIKELGIDEVRNRLYRNISPYSYVDVSKRLKSALNNELPEFEEFKKRHGEVIFPADRDDIFATYLQIPLEKRRWSGKHSDGSVSNNSPSRVVDSDYTPSVSSDNAKYKALTLNDLEKMMLVNLAIYGGDDISDYMVNIGNKPKLFPSYAKMQDVNHPPLSIGDNRVSTVLRKYFGPHTIGRGVDSERGEYISYYDKWDLSPFNGNGEDESRGIGKPIEFYDRIYLDDYFGIDSRPKKPDEFYGGYIKPAVFTEKKSKGGIIERYGKDKILATIAKMRGSHKFDGEYEETGQMEMRDKTRVSVMEPRRLGSKLIDWDAKEWLEQRAESYGHQKYTDEDIKEFESHIPEYLEIEKNAKKNGEWLRMPDGSVWGGDPRIWVIMQSKNFKDNYLPEMWWTGQGNFEPEGGFAGETEANRARFYDGEMWFSNSPNYASTFAYILNQNGLGIRDDNVGGHVFLAAIPKFNDIRDIGAPKEGTHDSWIDMPYDVSGDSLMRFPESDIKLVPFKKMNKTGLPMTTKPGYPDWFTAATLTDDVARKAEQLGYPGIYLWNVDDGFMLKNPNNTDPLKLYGIRSKYFKTRPINEMITFPGMTGRLKFIIGNNGKFDPGSDDKYSSVLQSTSLGSLG